LPFVDSVLKCRIARLAKENLSFPHFSEKKMNCRTEKTVITVETFQRTTARWWQKLKISWCERCAAETVMLAPNGGAALLQTTAREIFQLTEAGEIHYLETESGALLVYRNSLAVLVNKQKGE